MTVSGSDARSRALINGRGLNIAAPSGPSALSSRRTIEPGGSALASRVIAISLE